MRIRKISIENFRQLFGRHEVAFSTDNNRNVTVIHGENGAGKTSLLNAFKWCFYGTVDFDTGTDNLLNEHAITLAQGDKRISMRVAIEFDHDDMRYTINREQQFRRASGLSTEMIGGAIVELSWTDRAGNFEKASNPESLISQILPEKMHSYFFFNGERIEKLAYASASHEIREAIKTLMGLELVERAKTHLEGKVKRNLTFQIKQGASEELKKVIDRETELDELVSEATKTIALEDENIRAFKDELSVVGHKLSGLEAATNLQTQRIDLESRVKTVSDELSTMSESNKQLISERGFLAFFDKTSVEVSELLDERREKGELPYQIKQQFIDDLIANAKCICGADLSKGTPGYAAIDHYRHIIAAAGVEEAFIATAGALKQVDWSREKFFEQLKTNLKRRKELIDERDGCVGRLDDINKELKGSDQEDVVLLENKRTKLLSDHEDAVGRRAVQRGRIDDYAKELEIVVKKRNELAAKTGEVELAKRRLALAEECARVITELHDALARSIKEDLSKRVDGTFRKIMQKPYWAEIDDEYQLQIFKDVPKHGRSIVTGKSTAESQVTSLSFIASIVSLAKERYEKKEGQFFRGGLFPIVMDSPFGSLGPDYRQLIARHIPELADQVIVMVSPTQWRGEVEAEMKARVGAHITLVYHTPKLAENKSPSFFIRQDSDYEYSEFVEGYHG
jgi:DNA sulfur modification protein DndD